MHRKDFPIGARVLLNSQLRTVGVKGALEGVVVGYTRQKSVGLGLRGGKGHGIKVRRPGHRGVLTIGQDWLNVAHNNPRRRRGKVVGHFGSPRKIARAKYGKALRRQAHESEWQFRLRRAQLKSNPMSRKDFELMAAHIASFKLNGASNDVIAYLIEFAITISRASNARFDADRFRKRVEQLIGEKAPFRYVNNRARRNPHLAVVGAMNPPLGKAIELRYHRTAGEHPGFYRHKFTSRATVFAMKDGSLRIVGR